MIQTPPILKNNALQIPLSYKYILPNCVSQSSSYNGNYVEGFFKFSTARYMVPFQAATRKWNSRMAFKKQIADDGVKS